MCAVASLDPQRADTVAAYHSALERVIATMHDQLDTELYLKDMAKVAHMSPYHLNRVFSHTTGVPPGRFLTALRLEAAKRLLLTTEQSVTDICMEVGYTSLGTFTRRFSELVGVSPSRLREMAKAGPKAFVPALQSCLQRSFGSAIGPSVEVEVPFDFDGVVFVGLFRHAVPRGCPVACGAMTSPGQLRLSPAEDGDYFLMTAGLGWSLDPQDLFLYEDALRGGAVGQPITVLDGELAEPVLLRLRPPRLFDPPILLAFPLLIANLAQTLVPEPVASLDTLAPEALAANL